MNQLYEVHLHNSDSFYIIANGPYRVSELLGIYLENNRMSHSLTEGNYSIHPLDLDEEKVLARGTKCLECES